MAKKFVYDKGPQEKPTEGKHIIISVFFDGTQNNKTNTENPTKGKPQRDFWMERDKLHYDEFLHPIPKAEEVEKVEELEVINPNKEVVYEIKGSSELKEIVIQGFGRDGDSYENDYTNIARLFYGCVEKKGQQECIYIEGAGTEDNQLDDQASVATGAFFSSIRVKARDACKKIITMLNKNNMRSVDTLTIDVFGFSRGSATARYFTHFITCTDTEKEVSKYFEDHATPTEIKNLFDKAKKSYQDNFAFIEKANLSLIEKTREFSRAVNAVANDIIPLFPQLAAIVLKAYTEEQHSYFQQMLKEAGIQVNNISVRFVGLYDSVSSYGLFFDNDVKDLGLTAINRARKVVHLSAADEYILGWNRLSCLGKF